MEHPSRHRPPSLDLPPHPNGYSRSPPPRHPAGPSQEDYNEKATPLDPAARLPQSRVLPPGQRYPARGSVYLPDSARSYPATPSSSNRHQAHYPSLSYSRSRSSRWITLLKPWLPLIMYAATSLVFVVAIAWYRTELFTYLDELAAWLRSDEYGHAILFFLIFLTTIPPIPLYSTLIILSGYTYGPWTGAIISYFSALFGALVVFIVSRTLFRGSIERWLGSCGTIKRVVRAIEKRPKLLFLVRLAPYPYNVMNCLLAASPTLSLHTYTVCTALSLFKVIIHTSVGASIHSFKDYHNAPSSEEEDSSAAAMNRIWTVGGILLCILILVYLSVVANRAVDDELDDAPVTAQNPEETVGFLSADGDLESAHPSRDRPMSEITSGGQFLPYRSAGPDQGWS